MKYLKYNDFWKDVYRIARYKNMRIFIRNQWHNFSSESDFDLFKIGYSRRNGHFEIHISALGFKIVFFKSIYI